MAKEAREAKNRSPRLFAGREGFEVVKTGPFTWMTIGSVPSIRARINPACRTCTACNAPGEDFMEAVFNSTPDQIRVALNEPKTVAYVIQVKDFEPPQDDSSSNSWSRTSANMTVWRWTTTVRTVHRLAALARPASRRDLGQCRSAASPHAVKFARGLSVSKLTPTPSASRNRARPRYRCGISAARMLRNDKSVVASCPWIASVPAVEPQSLARVFVGRPRVGPIADRIATDPGGHVVAGHHQSHREPGEIVGHHAASILPAIESAGAAIDRLRAVAVLEAVLNLALVSLPELAGNAAEEDSRVEMLAVGKDFGLQDEVGQTAAGFPTARCRPFTFSTPSASVKTLFLSG